MADDNNIKNEADGQNAPQHTQVTPSAQVAPAPQESPEPQGNPRLLEAQNKFLGLLNARMTEAEGLGVLALHFPESQYAATKSYGARWRLDARRCFTVVARLKRRMREDKAS